jgi:hypothetical protein
MLGSWRVFLILYLPPVSCIFTTAEKPAAERLRLYPSLRCGRQIGRLVGFAAPVQIPRWWNLKGFSFNPTSQKPVQQKNKSVI